MPIYEFECEECGKVCEILVFSSEELKENDTCECGGKLRRLFSRTSALNSAASMSSSSAGGGCGSSATSGHG